METVETILRDVRQALRGVRRAPLFSLVVVLSLGVAIGANTAILNLAYQLFLRALPIAAPERVVALFSTQPDLGAGAPMSFLNWKDVQDQSESLAQVAGYEWESLAVKLDSGMTRVPAQLASGNYFDTLGVSAMLGRTFSDAARRFPGADLEVVVSHHFWRRYLGGDPDAVGRTLEISGQPFTIVGVTGAEFQGLNVGLQVELWIPFGVYRQIYPESLWIWYETRRDVLIYGVGRLSDDASLEQVRAELAGMGARLEQAYPEANKNRGIQALPIAQATIFPWARPFVSNGIWLLSGAVLLTLLIASVNVANLFLARTRERAREVAIRLALGVSRGALATSLVIESVVLAFFGGCAGLWFLWLTQEAMRHVIASVPSPTAGPYALTLELDPMLLLVAFMLSMSMGLVLGLFPVLAASFGGGRAALGIRGEARTTHTSRFGFRNGLLVTQLALSFVALLGGALFLRSLDHIRDLDPGFEPQRLAFLRVDLSASYEPGPAATAARARIIDTVAGLPGVMAVGLSPREAMDGGWSRPMAPAELASDPNQRISPYTDRVDDGFFDAMGLAMLEGRTFTREEQLDSPRVAVVNQTLASRLWPVGSAVGRSLVLFDVAGDQPLEIVGVVENSKYRRVTENPEAYVYMPLSSDASGLLTLSIRTSGDPAAVLAAARSEVRRLEPLVPITSALTVIEVLNQSMWGPRLAAAFLGVFAFVALLLSAVGIYGVISYDVSQRLREFCIRVAVGAQHGNITGLVLRQCGKHYLLGVLFGIPLAYATSRWVSHMIFVDMLDPYAGFGSLLPLILVGLLASLIPARRASAVDPSEVLRSE